ncbi:hypothetical protein Tco_0134386 [Tanacetum coccineum]
MFADLKYVQSLEKEIDELESDKADFSNIYDLLLQECVSKDVVCSYLHSLSDFDAHTELQCLYHHKIKECDCLAEKLSKQTKNVGKQEYNELLQSFSKLEQHSNSLELALQQCQEEMKNDTNIAISELKKLIEKMKVVRQPSAYKSERSQFPKHRFASQVDVSNDLTKPVTPHSWPQVRKSSFAKPYHVNAPGPSRNWPPSMSSRVNSRASAQKKDARSHKTTKRYMPVEKKSDSKKHDRQVPIGQKFSPNKPSDVWIPIRKSVETCYHTNDSASPLGKATPNHNTTICANSSSLSAVSTAGNTLKEILIKFNLPDHRYQDYQDKDCQERLLASFQDDAKYEHVGQDTRSQGGNDDKDKQGNDLKISKLKTKSKDNDKGSRSKIA